MCSKHNPQITPSKHNPQITPSDYIRPSPGCLVLGPGVRYQAGSGIHLPSYRRAGPQATPTNKPCGFKDNPNSNSNSNPRLGGSPPLTMPQCIEIGNWERSRIPNSNPNSKGLEFGIWNCPLGGSPLSPCQSALELGIGSVAEFSIPIPIPRVWILELSSWEYFKSHHARVHWNWEFWNVTKFPVPNSNSN